jgi:hypothetical protein
MRIMAVLGVQETVQIRSLCRGRAGLRRGRANVGNGIGVGTTIAASQRAYFSRH